ncbi:MAG: hypothetical protein OXN27_15715 [Candidatus Poribacteria bacterium]|nr:hypothetical protein [Candidatus Poribacteria bacterium]
MAKIAVRAISTLLIFAFAFTAILPAAEAQSSNNLSTPKESKSILGLPSLIIIGVTSFGRWLTPLDEWQAEIHKLTEDELFVQRWLLVNNDFASLEKGKRAIMKIQKRREAIKKRRNRFLWWYYPTITVIGAGAGMLTFWLQRN